VKETTIELRVAPGGTTTCIYCEDLDLARLGEVQIRRASHCEADQHGQWWADLAPVAGPKFGPYLQRSQALAAEVAWLQKNWLLGTRE
jgi:hypothetical protein